MGVTFKENKQAAELSRAIQGTHVGDDPVASAIFCSYMPEILNIKLNSLRF